MVQRRYMGVTEAKERFERMRPAIEELTAMMQTCKPFSPDYCVLLAAREALATAAFHFTREPYMFGGQPP